jgi:hypothetical protein
MRVFVGRRLVGETRKEQDYLPTDTLQASHMHAKLAKESDACVTVRKSGCNTTKKQLYGDPAAILSKVEHIEERTAMKAEQGQGIGKQALKAWLVWDSGLDVTV